MDPFNKFYDYQKEAISKTIGKSKGIVCLPTGTGKTFIEAGMIAKDIMETPGFNLYVVNSPRILLSFQLCKEIFFFLHQCGKEARYMFVHSGGTPDETEMEEIRIAAQEADKEKIKYSVIESGTSKEGIKEMMSVAKKQGLPLIIISTYNSCARIEPARAELKLDPIRLVVNDEAHYLVQERFFDVIHILTCKQCFFFTATTKETPSEFGRGMNNKEAYGDIIYSLEPRQAIDMGKIVKPRLHYVSTTTKVKTEADIKASTNRVIEESFYQHTTRLVKDATLRKPSVKELNLSDNHLQPKLLVCLRGIDNITQFLKSSEYERLRQNNVNIFSIASTVDVGNNINGEKVRRPEFLKRLKEVGNDPTSKVIALHYDILSEGISINGFTGILVLRTLTKTKFIQSYGRTARLHPTDRENFDKGLVKAWEWEKQMKPFSYVLIPNISDASNDQKEQLKSLVILMREYGYDFAEHIIGDQTIHGEYNVEVLNGLNEPSTLSEESRQMNLKLEELFAEIEEAEAASLDPQEFVTQSRCTALGLTKNKSVKTPQGLGTIVGYRESDVRINLKSGEPIQVNIEILTKLNPSLSLSIPK